MGVWSKITGAAGSLLKNTVKAGIGYGIGEAVMHSVSDSDDPSKAGMAGIAGIAGIYAVPALGSKMFGFFKGQGQDVNDPEAKDTETSCWKTISKMAAVFAGGAFVATQTGKWLNEYKDATNNIHDASENEYLQLGNTGNVSVSDRTGDELTENIYTGNESVTDVELDF